MGGKLADRTKDDSRDKNKETTQPANAEKRSRLSNYLKSKRAKITGTTQPANAEGKSGLSNYLKSKKAKRTVRNYVAASAALALFLSPSSYVIEGSYMNKVHPNQIHPENIKMAETLNRDTKKLEVIVSAIKQNDVFDVTYLANGRTDKGWWYQGGLGYSDGEFKLIYEVWNNKGRSVVPGSGSGSINFSKKVNEADRVVISEKIEGNLVRVSAKDLNTGATARIDLDAYGKVFKGGEINGYPTGVFTEIWAPKNFDTSKIKSQKFHLVYPARGKNAITFMSIDTYRDESDMYSDVAIPTTKATVASTIGDISDYIWGSWRPSPVFGKMQITAKMNELITEGVPSDKEKER